MKSRFVLNFTKGPSSFNFLNNVFITSIHLVQQLLHKYEIYVTLCTNNLFLIILLSLTLTYNQHIQSASGCYNKIFMQHRSHLPYWRHDSSSDAEYKLELMVVVEAVGFIDTAGESTVTYMALGRDSGNSMRGSFGFVKT